MRPDSVATGSVWHRRNEPRRHAFNYRMWLSLLDVDEIESRFRASRFWSLERFNLVTLRRRDYLGPPELGLGEAVRRRVEQASGFRPSGRVRMLTHLRQWGMCFNPVTFYFCESARGELQAIVADIHNTPWNERHAYVLDARAQTGPEFRFEFDKEFHVSPFLPMDMRYDWRFRYEADRIDVHMRVMRDASECFATGMRLVLDEMTPRRMVSMPLRFPFMTLRVSFGIYYQALRLWLKRIPFISHPDSAAASGTRSS